MGKVVFAIGAALLAAVAATEFREQDGVLDLDEATFDAALTAHDPLLVAFVAPWCGHCKRLKPEYAKAARALKKDNIRIAMVDATANKALADRFDVTGFPTIKFFRGGEPSEYNGGREEAAIVSWLRKRSGPPAVRLLSLTHAQEWEEEAGEVAVVAFVDAKPAAEEAFFKVASSVDDVSFAVTEDAGIRASFAGRDVGEAGVDAPAADVTAVLLADFDGDEIVAKYTGSVTNAKEFKAWISAHSLPEVVTFSQEAAPRIFRGEQKTHFLLFTDKTATGAQGDAFKAFRAAAKHGKGRALFVAVPPSEDKVLGYFGITAEQLPTAVLVHMSEGSGMKKYRVGDDLSTEHFVKFLDDYEAGKLKPFLKSDPLPDAAENAAAGVKVVVGGNFESLVMDPSKDVLLEIYAPWCGHCKQLAPVYEQLGAAVKKAGISTLVIAKSDGTGNEFEDVPVRGFPTIVFFPASKEGQPKRQVEFDGGRDLEGFVTFLKNHATHKFELDVDEIEDAE